MREKQGPSHHDAAKDADEAQAAKEKQERVVSKPGGFKNDPADPTNPNEAIERSRRQLRP